jgi:UDP-N-acetylglucosamine/UDP-N-acetylgalactosamine diphosphorylase
MTGRNDVEVVRRQLAEHHQGHLLTFWPQLDARRRRALLDQIRELDLTRIDEWVEHLVKGTPAPAVATKDFEPAPSYSPEPRDAVRHRKYQAAIELGEKLVSQGKVAAITVAGGQGTRLGFDGPKGSFPISPIQHKTLFRVFAETIQAVTRRYGATCPWFVMTSPMNHAQTVAIFKADNYYGLEAEDVFLFQQGTLPNFAFDGQILLEDKARMRAPRQPNGAVETLFPGTARESRRQGRGKFWLENRVDRAYD